MKKKVNAAKGQKSIQRVCGAVEVLPVEWYEAKYHEIWKAQMARLKCWCEATGFGATFRKSVPDDSIMDGPVDWSVAGKVRLDIFYDLVVKNNNRSLWNGPFLRRWAEWDSSKKDFSEGDMFMLEQKAVYEYGLEVLEGVRWRDVSGCETILCDKVSKSYALLRRREYSTGDGNAPYWKIVERFNFKPDVMGELRRLGIVDETLVDPMLDVRKYGLISFIETIVSLENGRLYEITRHLGGTQTKAKVRYLIENGHLRMATMEEVQTQKGLISLGDKYGSSEKVHAGMLLYRDRKTSLGESRYLRICAWAECPPYNDIREKSLNKTMRLQNRYKRYKKLVGKLKSDLLRAERE
jgi:hypothetical protein